LEQWEQNKLPLDNPEVQDWIEQVMGYFKGCYSGYDYKTQKISWDASDLRCGLKTNEGEPLDAVLNQYMHAGVHLIRKYYPEFKLTEAIVKNAYWGNKN